MRSLGLRFFIKSGILIVLVIGLVFITPQGRIASRVALFIPQILPDISAQPLEWFTPDPVWQKIKYPTSNQDGFADLVIPGEPGDYGAVLFYLGVFVDHPREDPRIVALAEGLARSGMVVLIPWSNTQIHQRINLDDVDDLVLGFQYLRSLDFVDPEKVGLGGICTGASMVTIAAQDERIRNDVKFINFFAGYYDAFDLTKSIVSNSRFYGDIVLPWEPDELTYQLFSNHMIDGVVEKNDRDILSRIFISNEVTTLDEINTLSAEGMIVYKLLNGVSFDEADELIFQLSDNTKEFLRRASPSTNIDRVKARVLIMHDVYDNLVPSEESRRLADALSGDERTYHTEFSLFQNEIQLHMDDDAKISTLGYIQETIKLYMHLYNVFKEIS